MRSSGRAEGPLVPVGQKAQSESSRGGKGRQGGELRAGLGVEGRLWGGKVRHVEVMWPRAVQAVEKLEKEGPGQGRPVELKPEGE